jgi:hypothetical protein
MLKSNLVGLQLDEQLTFDRWREVGVKICRYCSASSWWIGDWLTYGRSHYGERYKDAVGETGLDYQTLRNYATVARRFPVSRRRDNLSFQHHAEVCSLDDADQDFWLDAAVDGHWSRTELRHRVRASRERQASSRSPVVVRLVVDLQREQHWRDAAQESDQELDGWITEVLDREAAAILERPPVGAVA